MLNLKKIKTWILWIILVLLAMMAAAQLVLPYVVNSNRVKEIIRGRVQAAVNGQFDYTRAKLGLLPRPHGAIIDAKLSVPGKIDISAASVSIALQILPLLTGKIKMAVLSVQSPVVKLPIPAGTPSSGGPGPQRPRDWLKEKAAAVQRALGPWIKDGRIKVDNGHLVLLREAKTIGLEEVDLELAEINGLLGIEIRGRSRDIDQFSGEARINYSSLDGGGRLKANGIRMAQILATWFPEKQIDIPDAELDLNLTFDTQGLETWQAVLNCQIPKIPLSQDGQQLLQQVELNSTLAATSDHIDVTLSRLKIESPGVGLSGSLRWQLGSREKDNILQVAVQADTIDLSAVRPVVINLLGNTPSYLNMVRGGIISDLHAASQAAGWSGLMAANNLFISGAVKEGSIRIPGPDMDLTEVAGQITFDQGTLAADQATARMGTSRAVNGRLSMDLMAQPVTLNLTMDLDADLTRLPDIMNKFVGNEQIQAQLNNLTITQGRALGTLSLAGNLDKIGVTLDAHDISLTLEDRRLPSALVITGDQFSYAADGIGFKNIGARLQGSRLSRLSGRLHWNPEPTIVTMDLQDAGADLVCEELYPLLRSALGHPLPAMAPKTLEGRIVVTHAAIKGPLSNPRQWQFKASGDLAGIVWDTDLIADPLTIKSGQFGIDPQKINLSKLAIQWLDAALDLSARVTDYQAPDPLIELKALKGDIGERAAAWIHQRLNLDRELRTRTPVSIKTAGGRWQRDKGVDLQGELIWPDDLNLSLALSAGDHEFRLDQLRIADDQTDVSMSLRYDSEARQLDMRYKGHLDKTSLAKLWLRDDTLLGEVDGDFWASIMIDTPRQSVLQGQLNARKLILPLPSLDPITINAVGISGHDRTLDIHNLNLTWLQQQLQLNGKVDFSGDFFQVNMDLLSKDLDLTSVEKALARNETRQESSDFPPQRSRFKVQGTVNLDIARLQYDNYNFQPLRGELVIDDDTMILDIAQANLCGITTEGRVELTNGVLSVDIKPIATGQPLQLISGCLTGSSATERFQGAYDIDGRIATRGQNHEELIRNLDGHIELNIKDGRIHNVGGVGVFTNLLAHLKLNNIISGDTADLSSNDFLYKTLSLQMDIKGDKIALNEAYLKADSLNLAAEGTIDPETQNIDLIVLVSPLTTLDTLVSYIPIVGKILKGTLVAVPVRVRGDISDPTIIPLSIKAVGSRVIGILERTLKAPFQIIDLGNTEDNEKQKQTEKETGAP